MIRIPQGSRVLILEDDPRRMKEFRRRLIGTHVVHAETASECIAVLSEDTAWDVIFLDHDLGGEQMVEGVEGTGYEVALWIYEHMPERPPVVIHSANPVGARRMRELLFGSVTFSCAWLHVEVERPTQGGGP